MARTITWGKVGHLWYAAIEQDYQEEDRRRGAATNDDGSRFRLFFLCLIL